MFLHGNARVFRLNPAVMEAELAVEPYCVRCNVRAQSSAASRDGELLRQLDKAPSTPLSLNIFPHGNAPEPRVRWINVYSNDSHRITITQEQQRIVARRTLVGMRASVCANVPARGPKHPLADRMVHVPLLLSHHTLQLAAQHLRPCLPNESTFMGRPAPVLGKAALA